MQDEAPQDGGEPVAPPTQPVPHLAVAGEVVSPGPDGLTTALRLGLGLVGAAVEQVARTVDPATPVTTVFTIVLIVTVLIVVVLPFAPSVQFRPSEFPTPIGVFWSFCKDSTKKVEKRPPADW